MNERLVKLWEQANIRYDMDYVFAGVPRDARPSIPEIFAELIIKECLSSIQSDMDSEVMNGTMSLAKHAGMVSAKTVIKKHFGVEE